MTTTPRSKIKNKVIGLDLRNKIIEEGALKPFGLTVGINYTHADGSIDITNTYASLSTTVNGHTASVSDGMTTQHSDWKTDSVGLQAILDKQIFFITPYLGASINRNSGDINNSITTTGTPVIDGTVADPADASYRRRASSTDKANKWDARALLGIDFSILPFVKLGIQGEYAEPRTRRLPWACAFSSANPSQKHQFKKGSPDVWRPLYMYLRHKFSVDIPVICGYT